MRTRLALATVCAVLAATTVPLRFAALAQGQGSDSGEVGAGIRCGADQPERHEACATSGGEATGAASAPAGRSANRSANRDAAGNSASGCGRGSGCDDGKARSDPTAGDDTGSADASKWGEHAAAGESADTAAGE